MRLSSFLAPFTCIVLLGLLLLGSPVPGARAQEPTSTVAPEVQALIEAMSPEERVGQLFLVTFPSADLSEESVAARLVRDLHVGGVVLRASNGNYRNDEGTASSLVTLTNGLQDLAFLGSEDVGGPFVPLLVAIDQVVLSTPYADGLPESGFTRVPSEMALGATWNEANAEQVGRIIGQELRAVGINLLLGPLLDVAVEPNGRGTNTVGSHTFGGSPYWVGQMGRAFVRGVHAGGGGQVATVARHFPGLGSSDRAPSEEIATVQKPMEALLAEDLAPFFAVTEPTVPTDTIDGLMTTNLRYRALQGNVRQTTRPISLDAQSLPTLLAHPAIQPWREAGGLVVSDELGAPALRRFYQQQQGTFPARTVARDAFNAGSDLLFLADFAQSDDWSARLANVEETIRFFAEQYESDAVFASEVDASLRRLLALKLRLYGGDFDSARPPLPDPTVLNPSPLRATESLNAVSRIAQEAATLLYPNPLELAAVLPAPPLGDESLVIVTDARTVRDCATCPPRPILDPTAFQASLLRRYGPSGSGVLDAEQITSLELDDLRPLLDEAASTGVDAQALQATLDEADWLIFLMHDSGPDAATADDTFSRFLRASNSQLRGQKLIVFSFGTPYTLDSTEISKVTAFYGFYTPTPTFVDAAVLLLFQGYSPSGALPVTVRPLNSFLSEQLMPDPGQTVQLCEDAPDVPAEQCDPLPPTLDVEGIGGELALRTSVIRDRNGNPVPDGTLIHFILRYPNENIEQPRQTVPTEGGVARTSILLDRQGQLVIYAVDNQVPSFNSTTVQITIQGSEPPVVVTVEPTVTPTPTPTPLPTITPTASASPAPRPPARPTPTPTPLPPTRLGQPNEGFGWWTFLGALVGLVAVGSVGLASSAGGRTTLVRRGLLVALYGLSGYLLYLIPYAFRWLPESFNGWGAIFLAIVGGFVALLREP